MVIVAKFSASGFHERTAMKNMCENELWSKEHIIKVFIMHEKKLLHLLVVHMKHDNFDYTEVSCFHQFSESDEGLIELKRSLDWLTTDLKISQEVIYERIEGVTNTHVCALIYLLHFVNSKITNRDTIGAWLAELAASVEFNVDRFNTFINASKYIETDPALQQHPHSSQAQLLARDIQNPQTCRKNSEHATELLKQYEAVFPRQTPWWLVKGGIPMNNTDFWMFISHLNTKMSKSKILGFVNLNEETIESAAPMQGLIKNAEKDKRLISFSIVIKAKSHFLGLFCQKEDEDNYISDDTKISGRKTWAFYRPTSLKATCMDKAPFVSAFYCYVCEVSHAKVNFSNYTEKLIFVRVDTIDEDHLLLIIFHV